VIIEVKSGPFEPAKIFKWMLEQFNVAPPTRLTLLPSLPTRLVPGRDHGLSQGLRGENELYSDAFD
jgi:hypothetical protein